MEEINDATFTGNATVGSNVSNILDLSGNEKPAMDTDGFETLEVSGNLMDCDFDLSVKQEPSPNDPGSLHSSGLMSTTRPLLTTSDDDAVKSDHFSTGEGSDIFDKKLADERSSPSDNIKSKPTDDRSFEKQTPAPDVAGDALSISDEDTPGKLDKSESLTSASFSSVTPAPIVESFHESEAQELLPNSKNPKIDTKLVSELENPKEQGIRACETIAQRQAEKSEVAMEAETSAGVNPKADSNCPFSPGSLFNPERLHHTVAEYVYWRDVKKTGLVFGSSLVLLLSLTYFSLISVVAYVALALLSITITFRVYKNVLQAVQKSNEGHPFKEYLEMDINLSPETVKETSETLVHHVNCVTNKLRSFFLVEDLVDSLKLVVFLWCMTYVGGWFNGMTLVILALVSVFTLPKVYETNKTQIDHYMNLVRTQLNDVCGKINAKIPLCKKKKEQ